MTETVQKKIKVTELTDGILDFNQPMLGPLADGGIIEAVTAPGCWGPMITPCLKGGHEVTRPVFIDNAEPGDAVVIRIKRIRVTSIATASGTSNMIDGFFTGDPFISKRCPACGTERPQTFEKNIGEDAVRCSTCGNPVTPFKISHGYTVVFDEQKEFGITVSKNEAEKIAANSRQYANMPSCSRQHSILLFAPHHLAGAMVRLRPFLGQLGTTPAVKIPDSHNAGDFGSFLIGAAHEYALTTEQLKQRTDGHMDIDIVREGAIVVAPVKVKGAGIYMGDMHALQGDGEIAGHTMDVSGEVTLQINLIKGLNIDGPLIFPLEEDLPFLARPFSKEEQERVHSLADEWGAPTPEKTAPISFVGTGPDLNSATDNGLQRAASILSMSIDEVKNRATINGGIEIGRHPGVVQITFLAPLNRLTNLGLLPLVKEQYSKYF